MSLAKYLEEKGIDQIEDDQEFMMEEYEAVGTYCENCDYSISDEDLKEIKRRGLLDSFNDWKENLMNSSEN